MSFGAKLPQLPAEYSPNEEIIVTLEFTSQFAEFNREIEIYVEEVGGTRPIKLTVKSAPHGGSS